MKYFFFILLSLNFYYCIAQQQYSIRDLKSGKFKEGLQSKALKDFIKGLSCRYSMRNLQQTEGYDSGLCYPRAYCPLVADCIDAS